METLFNKILENIQADHACVMATVVSSVGSSPRKVGAKMLVFSNGDIDGTIGGGGLESLVIRDAIEAFRRKKSFLKEYPLDEKSGLQVCGGKVKIFLDVILPDKKLIICGGGHIGLALSFLGKLLGFKVILIDNRRAFASSRRFAHVDKIVCGPYEKSLKRIPCDKKTHIVIVTHGHAFDRECLTAALKAKAGYIGMIGSKTKIKLVFQDLKKKGFKQSQLEGVYTPIGLSIGAQTPEEISVAIAAQLIQHSKAA